MNKPQQYFKLFACCVPVRGAKRSVVCDLQRNTYEFIPNSLYDVIEQHEGKRTIEDVKSFYQHEYDEVIDSYFTFLQDRQFLFFTDEPEAYPDLSLEWEAPALISNAIIDTDQNSNHLWKDIFSQLDELGCKAVELRFFDTIELEELDRVLSFAENGRLRTIDLIVKYDLAYDEAAVESLCLMHQRINQILIHTAPEDGAMDFERASAICFLHQEAITSANHCGQISHANFTVNYDLFSEAQLFNTCLNKKISIDQKGQVKNCPSMTESYGLFGEVDLISVVLQKDFKKYWEINKDQISVCKDCEFRYICTDCRVFRTDKNDLYSKPAKCGYNPYEALWESQAVQ